MEAVATIRPVTQFLGLYAVICSKKDIVQYCYFHFISIIGGLDQVTHTIHLQCNFHMLIARLK